MADKTLFPVFEVPEIVTPQPAEEQKYQPSVYFDYDIGDFRRDSAYKMLTSTGKEAYEQWCRKIVMTERLACLSYSSDIGTEMYDAMSQSDRAAVESNVERTVNEALMVNPKTEYVRGFEFIWNSDTLFCVFVVKGNDWEEQQISIQIKP